MENKLLTELLMIRDSLSSNVASLIDLKEKLVSSGLAFEARNVINAIEELNRASDVIDTRIEIRKSDHD